MEVAVCLALGFEPQAKEEMCYIIAVVGKRSSLLGRKFPGALLFYLLSLF